MDQKGFLNPFATEQGLKDMYRKSSSKEKIHLSCSAVHATEYFAERTYLIRLRELICFTRTAIFNANSFSYNNKEINLSYSPVHATVM
jgi:hypothetical protein